jgi:predicted O-linked N-acetylglucosamine transferase (SPINDLY family)
MAPAQALPHPTLQRLHQAEEWSKLIMECNTQLTANPRNLWPHVYMGFALFRQQRLEESVMAYDQGLYFFPNNPELLINKGKSLASMGRLEEAIQALEHATQLTPKSFPAWQALMTAYHMAKHTAKGYACIPKCEEAAKNNLEKSLALNEKSAYFWKMGNTKDAISTITQAIALYPENISLHSNRLLFSLSDTQFSTKDIQKFAKEYGKAIESKPLHQPKHHEFKHHTPWNKLRIGFISPDIKSHAVAYFVSGIFSQLDRRQFTIIGIQLNEQRDEVSNALINNFDEHFDISRLNFLDRRETISRAKIDIMIDLAGHTADNGLLLLSNKPAPVQVSWLGYPATTGMKSIDYKITDQVCDLPDAHAEYTERLARMETLFCCYRPHIRSIAKRYSPAYEVKPAPAIGNGYVTFGCCNNLAKLTDEVLTTWGQLLQRLPSARLLIEGAGFDLPDMLQHSLQRCESLGLPRDRLILVPRDEHNQYLTYHRIDIALDPFPLTGGTTSFDLLWMGVPLVSMEGTSFRSRMGTGMLTYLGKTEWLAHSPQEYVDIAVRLASDIEALNRERLGQRERVERSPLMNESLFLSEFGKALRTMWIDWLAQQHHPKDPDAQRQWARQAWQQMPADWTRPAPLGVGLSTGQRISQPQAHALLNDALTRAQAVVPGQGSVTEPAWLQLAELAIAVLTAIPHDPVALHCLAQLEYTHGNQETGDAYLHHARKAAPPLN